MLPMSERPELTLRPIGYVLTAYDEGGGVPTQATGNAGETAEIVVFDELVPGLRGLEGFDYAWLVSWFDRSSEPASLDVVPHPLRETGQTFGVFATRSPERPNPLGLSLVRILGVVGARVRFAGVDLLDRTPVLDLKPYAPGVDTPPDGTDVRTGWIGELSRRSARPA
jgi:tRNA-Thr(GGU) m(6)t(6)A37 methyltransferase TsaA